MGRVTNSIGQKTKVLILGIAILAMGLPTIFEKGVFDEYDYWTGTVSLVIFALAEVVLFAWVFEWIKVGKKLRMVQI